MKLNTQKTEFCLFNRRKDNTILNITLNSQPIKQTDNPKLLGVILDRELKFKEHISYMEKKTTKSLSALHTVAKTEKVSVKNMVNIFRSIVSPQLEYAAPVWQIANCQPLEKIQRKGLAICLGLPGTAGGDSVDVLSGVLPIDLRIEELSIRECGKILAKDRTQKIASYFQDYRDSHSDSLTEAQPSPFRKMLLQLENAVSLTDTNMNAIEPEFSYLEYLQPSRKRPDYWNNLGSSKNRSSRQEEEAKKLLPLRMGLVRETQDLAVQVPISYFQTQKAWN